MIFCTRARPRPVPFRFEVKNGRKTRSRCARLDAGAVVVDDDPHELLRLVDLRLNDDDRARATRRRTPRRRSAAGC